MLNMFAHFRNFPEHNTYKTPIYFSSDWLNEYWDTIEVDDYRFVYMGPKGSWYCGIYSSYTDVGCKSLYPNLKSVFVALVL